MSSRTVNFIRIVCSFMLSACAAKRPASTTVIPDELEFILPDAATELLYVHESAAGRDSIRVYMIGPDSCLDVQGGRRVSVIDYLKRETGIHLNRVTLPEDTVVNYVHCDLNGRPARFKGFAAAGSADIRLSFSGNRLHLPALAERKNETLRLAAVIHRSSRPDPLGLGKGSLLTYRYRYNDTAGRQRTEQVLLRINRFDDRAGGVFARVASSGADTLLRYGILNAELEPFSGKAVLWLLPDSYCRPRPVDFSGNCQLFWLRRDMLQGLLSAKSIQLLLSSYGQEQPCVLNGGEDAPFISPFRLQLNDATIEVDACEFSFHGGRAVFMPCAANPLLLSVELPGVDAYLELVGVER